MGADWGAVKGNIFRHAADTCEHTQMKNTCTLTELVWSLFLVWKRFLPGIQNPRRKSGAVAERRHKVVVTEARRKGKERARKACVGKAVKWGCWLQPWYLTVGPGML